VKWRFLSNEQSQFQLGIYPQLLLPTGDHARGLGEGRPALVLPLLAQKNWEKWTLYGNVGFWWQTAAETRDYVYAGAVLECEMNERLTLAVELFGNSPKERDERSDVAFNVGGVWKLGQQLALRRWTRHRWPGACDGLHRLAVSNRVRTKIRYISNTTVWKGRGGNKLISRT
jgi:hypothetical protein